jgi:hypothetical protein
MPKSKLTEKLKKQLNETAPLLTDYNPKTRVGWSKTWQFKKFLQMPQQTIALFCGNQAMKTSSICYQYVMRVLGYHPVPKKNVIYFECLKRDLGNPAPHGFYKFKEPDSTIVSGWEKGTWNVNTLPKDGKCTYCGDPIVIHQRYAKKIRMCSETLPGDKESISDDGTQTAEIKNTIYPELKKWMPPYLIKKDITFRNPAMIVLDPLKGMELNGSVNKGDDIVFDFVSYSQTIQSGAGVQRMSTFCDEESPKDFWDEQIPRLLAEDGDLLLGLTPANQLSWSFDEVFEQAQIYYRTQSVCDYLNSVEKDRNYTLVETTDSPKSIGVLQASTDDNPTLGKEAIEVLFANVDDPDVMATRRYGIHRQVSGRIFKGFDYKVHYQDFEKYFPDGIFHDWNHYRLIDYHPHNKWAVSWVAISPENEAFAWMEWEPDPERIITRMIANEIALMSADYKFKCNLIDPLAAETQTNTGTTTVEDLNTVFHELKKEGVGTGGWWETWDTKGTRGREVVRERLKNAKQCKHPFNNKVSNQGITRYLPTLWISTRCPQTARSLKQWRLESWARSAANVNKDRKETPAQKWSHFCTALEALFKDKRVRPPLIGYKAPQKTQHQYFQGRRSVRAGRFR